jgi:hypothetical protein
MMDLIRAGTADNRDRRIADRDDVFHRTALRMPHGAFVSVDIVNISLTGLMARTITTIEPGMAVGIALPLLGERAVRIVWALGGRIGAEFVEPIKPAHYAPLLAGLRRGR